MFHLLKSGNNHGCDKYGCEIGHGKQETFVNCADIRLISDDPNLEQPQDDFSDDGDDAADLPVPTTTTTTTTTTTQAPMAQPAAVNPSFDDDAIDAAAKDEGPDVDTSDDGCNCIAGPPYDSYTGMREWCCNNCRLGHCPESHCLCMM